MKITHLGSFHYVTITLSLRIAYKNVYNAEICIIYPHYDPAYFVSTH